MPFKLYTSVLLSLLAASITTALSVPTTPTKLYNFGADGSATFLDSDAGEDPRSLWIRRHQDPASNAIVWDVRSVAGRSNAYTICHEETGLAWVISSEDRSLDWLVLSNQSAPAVFSFSDNVDGTFRISLADDAAKGVLEAHGVAHTPLDYVKFEAVRNGEDFYLPFQTWSFV
ncbi:hypothetical protein MIND_00574800 [Mycena indigotica]|uniref:Uncharacterized protein n=1 Tax=Mycena indigotica TaxID=2126181 RepID=A0A8H6ST37_9AGAR|nr:uncharacterized protein MIND_00574800 [Mycena indigotica]KAF7303460.1 hypothetical protein MIND_00574800 [Mycena indigotica]